MPSAAARRLYEDQIPSFMSVFDLDAETMADRDTVTVVDPKFIEMEPTCASTLANPNPQHLRPATLPVDSAHKHHDSTSTQASESADSSPTTTLSTTDSSPLSDPSPSSSPDSPINLIPLSSYPATTFGGLPPMATLNAPEPLSLERPMTSPSPRRPRNMKGLSIQPPNGGSMTASLVSEPSSPSFIKPKIPAMKRKPSQLSLKTNSSDLIMRTTLEVPTSPALPPILQRRALKHSTSSPHMLAGLKSATFGPAGGMSFPKVLERNQSGLSELLRPSKPTMGGSLDGTILEEESPIKMQLASRAAIDFEPYREQENNEDQKTPGYPDGPIAIYDDNVFLYLEPTADEASRFDTVINVAREVANPFKIGEQMKAAMAADVPPPAPAPAPADDSPVPNTAVTGASYATAFEFPPTDDKSVETPTTPKATFPTNEPEYIHMPWDHNTDIAKDLMDLCETIEKRTQDGKKVLVHCQQGASRSASLIIAYGMYRNPKLSVNDAYYAAQERSRWISPNMKLMYCLQDFQKEVSKRRAPPGSAFGPRPSRSPTKHRLTLSADAIDVSSTKEPLTAPLPDEKAGLTRSPSLDSRSPIRIPRSSTPSSQPISPGPSSAPSSFSWMEKEDEKDTEKPGRFSFGELKPPPRPVAPAETGFASRTDFFAKPPPSPGFAAHRFGFSSGGGSGSGSVSPAGFGFSSLSLGPSTFGGPERKRESPGADIPIERHITVIGAFPDDEALMSPRAETMTKNPLHDDFNDFAGMRFVEVPPTPSEGLFSPRETMFPRDPFFPFGRPTQIQDPRSPPTKGETPIVRSIDNVLE